MALFPPLDATPEEVRAMLAPLRGDYSIALFGDNPFAVGAIIRTAHNFLAKEILLVGAGTYYQKASMGMEKYENVVQARDVEAFFAHIEGRPLVSIEKDDATASITGVERFPPGVVFAFGSEKDGLPREVIARSESVLGIPIYGVNHSLPVVVAAGIVMHEWARRHYRGIR
jgi:tRNA G18 (ribose-2'-O)-methylase SpoU